MMRIWLPRIRIPILYYHEIGSARGRHVVHPEDFRAQMRWLVEAGFEALSLDDLLDLYAGRRPPPPRPVLVTFDDGRAGVLEHAAPVLSALGMPAALYAVTDWLDADPSAEIERYSGFLRWPDLAKLRASGFTIGSHTLSHRTLKKLPPEEVEREIFVSKQRLEQALGAPVHHFSYPKGRNTRLARRVVRRAGYRTAVATGERWNGRFAPLHRLGRLRVDGLADLASFQQRLRQD
jgi:peptidoglycan/xylan/chitin deacetylase (PgdA/CDA1 family)